MDFIPAQNSKAVEFIELCVLGSSTSSLITLLSRKLQSDQENLFYYYCFSF